MVCQQVEVAVGQFFAIHLLDAVSQQTAVEADETALRQFANQGRNVLVLHVGVCVVFAACGGVGRIDIVGQEAQLLHCLAVLCMLLAVEDKTLGNAVIALLHQGLLHLVLYLFDGNTVVDV